MELGWRYPDRKQLLESLKRGDSQGTFPVVFQGENTYFPVFKVPIGFPKYRLNNGRTYAAQIEYLAKNSRLPKNYFGADPESDAAIKAQHEILKSMIKEKGLLGYFKSHTQTDPLILTAQGFVLNGNRRLCAMRELYEENSKKYHTFKHISIVVLPPADEKDLDELEARLQIHQDIKAEYSWITFALMLRRRQEAHGYTIDELKDLYDLKKQEVIKYLEMLQYADEYLAERNKEGEYQLLSKDEFAFRQIQARRKKLSTESDKDLFVRLGFVLVDDEEEGRVYQNIPGIEQHLETIKRRFAENIGVSVDYDKSEKGLLDIADGDGGAGANNLIDALQSEANRKVAREIIIDTIQAEQLRRKETKRKTFVLDQVRQAHAALSDAVSALDQAEKSDGIDKQLDAIDLLTKKIRKWFNG